MLEFLFYAAIIWMSVVVVKAVMLHMRWSEQRDRVMEDLDRRIRVVDLENLPEHNAILAYDKENQEFLGQGATVEDVKQVIMQRFPQKVFVLGDKIFSGMPQANVEIRN
jgi:hypothetical protein